MRRWPAAVGAFLLLPVVVIGAAVGAVLPMVGVRPIPAGGAVGLAAAARQAGFAGQPLRLAVAVGLAESGGDPAARRGNPPTPGCPAGSVDRGGWQLNSCYHPEVADACAYQLACAAGQTWRISAGGRDWAPWTAYSSGAWRGHLDAADRAIATLTVAALPPGYGTPSPCGLAPAADYAKHLIAAGFGITQIGGCDPDFRGHVAGSDHYPDERGQAHALDVMVGEDRDLGWQVATWATANATALQVTYVIFAGHIIDFRAATPAWHRCRDPASSCARQHFRHVHISFTATTYPVTALQEGLSPSVGPTVRQWYRPERFGRIGRGPDDRQTARTRAGGLRRVPSACAPVPPVGRLKGGRLARRRDAPSRVPAKSSGSGAEVRQ